MHVGLEQGVLVGLLEGQAELGEDGGDGHAGVGFGCLGVAVGDGGVLVGVVGEVFRVEGDRIFAPKVMVRTSSIGTLAFSCCMSCMGAMVSGLPPGPS